MPPGISRLSKIASNSATVNRPAPDRHQHRHHPPHHVLQKGVRLDAVDQQPPLPRPLRAQDRADGVFAGGRLPERREIVLADAAAQPPAASR